MALHTMAVLCVCIGARNQAKEAKNIVCADCQGNTVTSHNYNHHSEQDLDYPPKPTCRHFDRMIHLLTTWQLYRPFFLINAIHSFTVVDSLFVFIQHSMQWVDQSILPARVYYIGDSIWMSHQ